MHVTLGQQHVWKGTGVKRKCILKDDDIIYIPVLKTLEGLFQNEAILSKVCITGTL